MLSTKERLDILSDLYEKGEISRDTLDRAIDMLLDTSLPPEDEELARVWEEDHRRGSGR